MIYKIESSKLILFIFVKGSLMKIFSYFSLCFIFINGIFFTFPAYAIVLQDNKGLNQIKGHLKEVHGRSVVLYKMSLIGVAIRPKIRPKGVPYKAKFYFLISKQGKKYAYPFEFTNKQLEKIIEKTLGTKLFIETNIIRQIVMMDGKHTELLVLNPYKVTPLPNKKDKIKLTGLGLTTFEIKKIQKMDNNVISAQSLNPKSPFKFIPISDKAAESIILVTSSLLLANIISLKSSFIDTGRGFNTSGHSH